MSGVKTQNKLLVFWKKIKKHKPATVGIGLIFLLIVIAFIAPMISPYSPYTQNLGINLHAPNAQYWFGTDEFGRDELSRILYGTRVSLGIALASVVTSLLIGGILGLFSGFYGGLFDMLLSRIFDIMLGFPSVILAIAIVAILGPGLFNSFLAISITGIPIYGRLIRSQVLSVKEEEYIFASYAIGMSKQRILWCHVLPNSWESLIIRATLGVGMVILELAGLGFLGLGAQPPTAEWGAMLSEARDYMTIAPWLMFAPGGAIGISVLAFNLFGDGLRDALDPRTK